MRDSFVFYKSFAEAIDILQPEIYAETLRTIIRYALYDEMPDTENLSPAAYVAFTLIKPQIDANNRRYVNGCKGGRPRGNQTETKTKPKVKQAQTGQKPNVNDNDNENVNDKESNSAKKQRRFVPPTLEEVEEYCKERNSPVDAKKFYEYYTEGNWKDSSGKQVKSWKQKLITWEKSESRNEQRSKPNEFKTLEQNNYDFDELEKMLIQN